MSGEFQDVRKAIESCEEDRELRAEGWRNFRDGDKSWRHTRLPGQGYSKEEALSIARDWFQERVQNLSMDVKPLWPDTRSSGS